jgi:hypothetical protein
MLRVDFCENASQLMSIKLRITSAMNEIAGERPVVLPPFDNDISFAPNVGGFVGADENVRA